MKSWTSFFWGGHRIVSYLFDANALLISFTLHKTVELTFFSECSDVHRSLHIKLISLLYVAASFLNAFCVAALTEVFANEAEEAPFPLGNSAQSVSRLTSTTSSKCL